MKGENLGLSILLYLWEKDADPIILFIALLHH